MARSAYKNIYTPRVNAGQTDLAEKKNPEHHQWQGAQFTPGPPLFGTRKRPINCNNTPAHG